MNRGRELSSPSLTRPLLTCVPSSSSPSVCAVSPSVRRSYHAQVFTLADCGAAAAVAASARAHPTNADRRTTGESAERATDNRVICQAACQATEHNRRRRRRDDGTKSVLGAARCGRRKAPFGGRRMCEKRNNLVPSRHQRLMPRSVCRSVSRSRSPAICAFRDCKGRRLTTR